MKALEKDRTRRYETANGFAADVQRYLDDEPVQFGVVQLVAFARLNLVIGKMLPSRLAIMGDARWSSLDFTAPTG